MIRYVHFCNRKTPDFECVMDIHTNDLFYRGKEYGSEWLFHTNACPTPLSQFRIGYCRFLTEVIYFSNIEQIRIMYGIDWFVTVL